MNIQFKQNIFQISSLGQNVCKQLERGQAATPLADHFFQIESDINSAPFSIVLLGLTTQARTAALAWLYGKDFSVLSVNVVKQLGLIEISLREQGYTLERANGERQEFDRLEPFIQTLQASDILSPHDTGLFLDPVRLGINSASGIQGLKVYMPENPAMVLKNPGLLNRVVTEANLFVVAAPLHYDLSEQDQLAISEISQNMDGFWPLLTVDELEEDLALPGEGWWQQHTSPTVQLKPQLLTTHVDANIPSMLQDIDDKVRQALFLQLQAQRVIHACEAVDERNQQELRQLTSRKKREQRKAKTNENDVKLSSTERHQWDEIRNNLNDVFSAINQKQLESSKKNLLPDGELVSQLNLFVSKLQVKDLNLEPGHKTIKLTVKDQFIDGLKHQLKSLLKKQLEIELSSLADTLNTQQSQIESNVADITGKPQIFALTPPDEKNIWLSLKEQISVSIRYRGEMPKRGFMARLSDGRKAIMGISMIAMVIGGVFKAVWGIDFRAMVMLIAPLIFVGAIVYSYVVWPKEDEERFAKELDRIHDGLSSEIKRLLSDLEREKQTKINNHLDNEKKLFLRKLDELNRTTQQEQEQILQNQRQQAQIRLTQIEQKIKDMQLIERDISALKRQSDTLLSEGILQLKGLIN